MRADELDFDLPPDLIAQEPPARRGESRLLHFRRGDQALTDRRFADLPALLRPGDLLVFNDSKVVPARFYLRKPTGGRVEALWLGEPSAGVWSVLLKNAGPLKAGDTLEVDGAALRARVSVRGEAGHWTLAIDTAEPATQVLSRIGRMPLPPYIKRGKDADERDDDDRDRYQTVYASRQGSVAAPTAGLHFTTALLDDLAARGIEQAFVTLHVGLGTFKPVTADELSAHDMHGEHYFLSQTAAGQLNRARLEGRRIIAVGTTSARVLESLPAWSSATPFVAGSAETRIFIYPPYSWKHVDALITNFHLPRSTLIAMIAALVGLDAQRRIYAHAIAHRYRFFSYGDASFLE